MDRIIGATPIATVRANIRDIVTRIENDGLQAEPVVIGRRGNPAAVMISVELFLALADQIDALQSAQEIGERLAASASAGGPVPTSIAELAALAGLESPDPGEGPSVAGEDR